MSRRSDIRLSLPSKGRLAEDAARFLSACGLAIDKPNPRQYAARITALPGLTVLFQRPGDIVVSARDGSVDFGITGMDVVAERRGSNGRVLVLHDGLGFGHCHLAVAVPEGWDTVHTMGDLANYSRALGRPVAVVINRSDLGGFALRPLLQRYAAAVVAQMPFCTEVAAANADGRMLADPSVQLRRVLEELADALSSGAFCEAVPEPRARPAVDRDASREAPAGQDCQVSDGSL